MLQNRTVHGRYCQVKSQSGLALIRQAINRYTTLTQELDTQVPLRHGIKHSDVVKSYLGLVSAGENDFEAMNTIDSERFFTTSMGITDIPSEATLRQRMDHQAKAFLPVVEKASRDFLKKIQPELKPLDTGHIPLSASIVERLLFLNKAAIFSNKR